MGINHSIGFCIDSCRKLHYLQANYRPSPTEKGSPTCQARAQIFLDFRSLEMDGSQVCLDTRALG